MRGFVTPDRTTLIASAHRTHAVSEKIVPGDGQAPEAEVFAAMETAAKRLITADYQRAAVDAGSVISASLFGALAASDVLPFPRESFADVIRASGRGVDASLRAFSAGAAGDTPAPAEEAAAAEQGPRGPARMIAGWRALEARRARLPAPVRPMAAAGSGMSWTFRTWPTAPTISTAWIARWRWMRATSPFPSPPPSTSPAPWLMTTSSGSRTSRPAAPASTGCGARWGCARATSLTSPSSCIRGWRSSAACCRRAGAPGSRRGPRLARWIDRRINKGRRVRTDGLFWFAMLYLLAATKRWRRGLFRHRVETAHIERWLNLALETARHDRALATEILACRRLIKGYSDTHSRRAAKFDKVLAALPMLEGRADAADWLRRLREAALRDEKGEALEGGLKTVASFATEEAA